MFLSLVVWHVPRSCCLFAVARFGFCSGNASVCSRSRAGALATLVALSALVAHLSGMCQMCQMCQASAFYEFLSPFSSVLLQRRQDSLRAACAAPASWCSLGDVVVVTAQLRRSPSGVTAGTETRCSRRHRARLGSKRRKAPPRPGGLFIARQFSRK